MRERSNLLPKSWIYAYHPWYLPTSSLFKLKKNHHCEVRPRQSTTAHVISIKSISTD